METLVVVPRHRNQYCTRRPSEGSSGFYISPSKTFGGISCRIFDCASIDILSSPFNATSSPGAKKSCCSSPKTPSLFGKCDFAVTRDITKINSCASLPIDIIASKKERYFHDGISFSELWAGPAYSNSPPPSSVPIPKFSISQKRTLSLDLPGSDPVVKIHAIAKSAPSSPTWKPFPSPRDSFAAPDSASITLRRILNLEILGESAAWRNEIHGASDSCPYV